MDPDARWFELLDAFLTHEAAVAGLSPATLRNRRSYLEGFGRWWMASYPGRAVGDASAAELAGFLIAEAERGMAPRTRKAMLAALRRFYDWLVLTGHSASNPARFLQTPRVAPTDVAVYRPQEVAAILGHVATLEDVRGRQRRIIVAALRYTGMRSGELRGLAVRHLDLAAGHAKVLGKGTQPRIVLLPPPLVELLRAFLAEVRPLLPDSPLLLANAHPFVTTAHQGFGQEALAREVELAGLGADVAGRHFPHRWRHTFATELVRDGVDIHVVQRLLGHRSIASTVGYTHLALDDLRGVLDRRW